MTNQRREKPAEIPAVSSDAAFLLTWFCASINVRVLLHPPGIPSLSLLIPLSLGHLPNSCQEVRSMNALFSDGEHVLNVQGRALKVRF